MKKLSFFILLVIFSYGCKNANETTPSGNLSVFNATVSGFQFSPTGIFFMDGLGPNDLGAVQNAILRADKLVQDYNNDASHSKKYKIIDYDLQSIRRVDDESIAIIKVRVEILILTTP